jgi:hypothetical protein
MANYIQKLQTVTATQWWKMGDHPDVFPMEGHPGMGLLIVNSGTDEIHRQEDAVNAGDWLVEVDTGESYRRFDILNDVQFNLRYELLG